MNNPNLTIWPVFMLGGNMRKAVCFACLCLWAGMSSGQNCVDSIAESTPADRFIMNGDEVIDTRTQLIWQRCSLGQSGDNCETGSAAAYTWQQALQAAYTDPADPGPQWRLPNLKELQSIIEQSCNDPAVNLMVFPNTVSGWYWSASGSARNGSDAWAMRFHSGTASHLPKNRDDLHVRLVRNTYHQ